jgi:hypothetical protein
MVGDILEKSDPWPEIGHDVTDVWPQVTGILFGLFPSGNAEWLARISRSDDIHAATPRFAVKGSNVRPDRRGIQCFVFHARRKDAGRIGFPLNKTNGSAARDCEVKSKLKPASSRAKGQLGGGMTIHTNKSVK